RHPVVADRLQPQGSFDRRTRVRAGQHVESRSGVCHRSPEHNARAMLLAVDVGNTETHFGAFKDETLHEHWRFATVRQSTADQLGAALRNLLALRGLDFQDIDASIVSSTVPQLEPEWAAMASRYLGHETHTVGPGTRTGMAIRYDSPREIGPD